MTRLDQLSPGLQSILPQMSRTQSGPGKVNDNASFADAIRQGIASVDNEIKAADKSVEQFATTKTQSIPEVIIALERADISLKYVTQVRNKVLDAYNEVMRMPV